jgi:hypothetical protein
MMRLHRLNLFFLSSFIIVFLLLTIGSGRSQGAVLEWEPFKMRSDLALSISVVAPLGNKIIFMPDVFSEILDIGDFRDSYLSTLDTDRKSEVSWNRFNLRYLTLTFSHCATGQFERDMTGLFSNEGNKWGTIKSLPATFLHAQYRDTFESIGKIFEPQVNLGIEF